MKLKQRVLLINEHLSCKNYLTNLNTGFKYIEVKAGKPLGLDNLPFNYIYCTLQGRYLLSSGAFIDHEFNQGQMVLLPRMSSYTGRVIEDTKILVFGFDQPLSNCDKIYFETSNSWCKDIVYNFDPIPIHPTMQKMLDLLVTYLNTGIDCGHLHEIKHREFFIILRSFYTKQQMATLFYPLMGGSYDFRNSFLKHFNRQRSINEIIQLMGINRSSFFTQFKKEFKTTPKKWVAELIHQDIIYFANDPKLSVKEIMYKLDFDYHSQFNRFCQTNYGSTPTNLIEEIRNAQMKSQIEQHTKC